MAERLITSSSTGIGESSAPLASLKCIRSPDGEFDHCRERFVGRAMKAAEFPPAGRALPGPISACFQEVGKGPTEIDADHLDAQHNAEVIGGSKRESGLAEKDIAGSAANERVAIFVPGEILPEPLKSFHHVHCSSSRSTAIVRRDHPRTARRERADRLSGSEPISSDRIARSRALHPRHRRLPSDPPTRPRASRASVPASPRKPGGAAGGLRSLNRARACSPASGKSGGCFRQRTWSSRRSGRIRRVLETSISERPSEQNDKSFLRPRRSIRARPTAASSSKARLMVMIEYRSGSVRPVGVHGRAWSSLRRVENRTS